MLIILSFISISIRRGIIDHSQEIGQIVKKAEDKNRYGDADVERVAIRAFLAETVELEVTLAAVGAGQSLVRF